jgi:S-DNA-T family DNA segregation ATPase FtsK/SpoIIIE
MARRRKSIFGRRKSRTRTTRSRRKSKNLKFEVEATIVREIWAVIYLALAVFTFLSLSNNFGLVGEVWIGILNPILGWGIQVLPFALLTASFMLFFAKRIAFPLSRLMGIFLLVVSILSIMHLYVPMDALYSQAQIGNYGGYVGFVMNFLFREVLSVGHVGAFAVFATILVIGFLLTFEISLGAFLSFFKPQIKIVRKAGKKKKVEKEVVEEEEEWEDEEEPDFSEEDAQRERFKSMQGEQPEEMVTIKRPNAAKVEEEPKEHQIQITEGEEETALQSTDEDYVWEPPKMDLLHPSVPDIALDDEFLQDNARKIREKLMQFGIEVDMHEVNVGPTVIQYTLKPSEGIKLSKITGLKNDLALALAAKAVRIEAPIPGKALVGIEVPNDHRSVVHLRELLESKELTGIDSNLKIPLGRDVSGRPVCGDLAAMPHVLVAGATGAGKSVFMNSVLLSFLYQNSPADLKLIVIDPKRVELGSYDGLPHLLTPVVKDPEKAAIALRWVVAEMNRRYILLSEKKFKNINEHNEAAAQQETVVPDADSDEEPLNKMPKIVVVIDELADLMMAAGKEVEASICRIAQMARAVGIHLIVATQRPSVDVITGLIKANIPTRIAFAVSSSVDSRTIIDGIGAEDLLGQGDMLYLPVGMSKPLRLQGVFVSSREIEKVTNHIKIMSPPNYIDDVINPRLAQQKVQGIPQSQFGDDSDEMYEQALGIILESRKASASLLQRRLKVGYARAARLLDLMEENGVIGPVNGAKPREIYVE